MDNNRTEMLKKYAGVNEYKKSFMVDDAFMKTFVAFAEKKNVKTDEKGLATSDKLIRTQIKAIIAQDLWNTNAYFVIINDINNFYLKALESFNNDSFKKMKIVSE